MNKKYLLLFSLLPLQIIKPHPINLNYEQRPLICNLIIQADKKENDIQKIKNYLTVKTSKINETYNECPIIFHTAYWQIWSVFNTFLDLHTDPTNNIFVDLTPRYGSESNTILHALMACNAPKNTVTKLLSVKNELISRKNNDDETALETCLRYGNRPDLVATLLAYNSRLSKKTFEYAIKYKRNASLLLLEARLERAKEKSKRKRKSKSQGSARNPGF
jgi:ankyrin repeat protein